MEAERRIVERSATRPPLVMFLGVQRTPIDQQRRDVVVKQWIMDRPGFSE
jgi:hypothetical protein